MGEGEKRRKMKGWMKERREIRWKGGRRSEEKEDERVEEGVKRNKMKGWKKEWREGRWKGGRKKEEK